MSKFYSFIGQSLLAFLPVIVIQFMALSNTEFAASLSKSFAVVSVLFSISYMAQRQYVNIYGPIDNSLRQDIYFRLLNIVCAICLSLIILSHYEIAFYVAFFAASVKLSESLLDYLFGYLNFRLGFVKGSTAFLLLSFIRFIVLFIGLAVTYYSTGSETHVAYAVSIISSLIFIAVLCTVYLKTSAETNRFTLSGLRVRYKQLLPYTLSAGVCAFLVVMPRWIVNVGNNDDNIFLIAFSLVPVFGVLFNTLFASYIKLAKENIKKCYMQLVVISVSFCTFLYLLKPVLIKAIQIIYSYDFLDAEVFFNSVYAGVVFFAAILFANFYKFNKPYYESLSYIIGVGFILIMIQFNFSILLSLYAASCAVFLFSMYSLKVKK